MRMPGGEVALYDLVNNPDEHVNAAASNPDIVMQLDKLTNALAACSGQSCRTAEDEPAP
jgi:hypothetical protein